tara:strand:- start:2299 stop:2451 length:153 start_codon:yes stop_codon:yes gene_type:complete
VFEFTPEQACDTAGATGVQLVLDAHTSGKTVEGVTSYTMQGNLYVVVVTA